MNENAHVSVNVDSVNVQGEKERNGRGERKNAEKGSENAVKERGGSEKESSVKGNVSENAEREKENVNVRKRRKKSVKEKQNVNENELKQQSEIETGKKIERIETVMLIERGKSSYKFCSQFYFYH